VIMNSIDGAVNKIHGIIPPMFTPLSGQDDLDVDGLGRLIEHMLAGGVHGLFILGTTGQALSLSNRLRRELIDCTCRLVHGRVPVLVGITDTSLVESVSLAQHAARSGADAVVTSAPPYYPIGQPELVDYIRNLAERLPLPLLLYNMPTHTKVKFGLETIQRVMELECIAGIKDSSGDMVYFNRLLALHSQRPDWSFLMGPEELLAQALYMGADGGVNGGANLCPRLYVEMYEAALANDRARVVKLQDSILQISGKLYGVGRHPSSLMKGIGCALSGLGICSDTLALPYRRFDTPERIQLQNALAEMGITAAEPWPHVSLEVK